MVSRKTIVVSLILIILLACFTTVLMIRKHHTGSLLDDTQAIRHRQPDAFMVDAVGSQYDQRGKLIKSFLTSTISHYAYRNSTRFTKPNFIICSTRPILWHITADYGNSYYDDTEINLQGHVCVHQEPLSPQRLETTIKSSAMTIFPKQSIVKTNRHITIMQGESVVKGVGAWADFNTGVLHMIAHFRGIYATSKHTQHLRMHLERRRA